jgi:hypothetical protein
VVGVVPSENPSTDHILGRLVDQGECRVAAFLLSIQG